MSRPEQLLAGLIISAGSSQAEQAIEGYGAGVTGGAGQSTVTVTNLNDSGAGSLRTAIENQSNRIVVYDSSLNGELVLNTRLSITGSNVTFDGSDANVVIRPKADIWVQNADNILFKFLRIRGHADQKAGGEYDCLSLIDSTNIAVNHCSLFWASDEQIGINGSTDVTVQYSILAEGVKTDGSDNHSGHGMLIGDYLGNESNRVSVHHNLFISHVARCPVMGPNTVGYIVDCVNNVAHNIKSWGPTVDDKVSANIVKNKIKLGPDSGYPSYKEIVSTAQLGAKAYIVGNIGPSNSDPDADNWNDMVELIGVVTEEDLRVDERFSAPAVTTQSAENAALRVIKHGGCFLPSRDSEDARVFSEYQTAGGALIKNTPY